MKNNKGETLVESLVSLAILTIIMVGFPTLIVSVSNLNQKVKENEETYTADKSNPVSVSVSISDETTTYSYANVKGYKDGDYYFYEYE